MSEQDFNQIAEKLIYNQKRFYIILGATMAIILLGMMLLWNPLLKPWTQERKGMVKEYPEYRSQEFIAGFGAALENGSIGQIIYVPLETGLPITEAGKR